MDLGATPEAAEKIRAELAQIDQKMLAIVRNLSAEHADLANAALASLKKERAELEKRMREIEDSLAGRDRAAQIAEGLAPTVRFFAKVWTIATPEERKRILPAFVDRIDVNPTTRMVTIRMWRIPKKENLPPGVNPSGRFVEQLMVAGARCGFYPNAQATLSVRVRLTLAAHSHDATRASLPSCILANRSPPVNPTS